MVVKIFDKETCEKVGKIFFPEHPTVCIPDELFGRSLVVLRCLEEGFEVKSGGNLDLLGIGYTVPFQFIECLKEC